jgi:hypothetical protein
MTPRLDVENRVGNGCRIRPLRYSIMQFIQGFPSLYSFEVDVMKESEDPLEVIPISSGSKLSDRWVAR